MLTLLEALYFKGDVKHKSLKVADFSVHEM